MTSTPQPRALSARTTMAVRARERRSATTRERPTWAPGDQPMLAILVPSGAFRQPFGTLLDYTPWGMISHGGRPRRPHPPSRTRGVTHVQPRPLQLVRQGHLDRLRPARRRRPVAVPARRALHLPLTHPTLLEVATPRRGRRSRVTTRRVATSRACGGVSSGDVLTVVYVWGRLGNASMSVDALDEPRVTRPPRRRHDPARCH